MPVYEERQLPPDEAAMIEALRGQLSAAGPERGPHARALARLLDGLAPGGPPERAGFVVAARAWCAAPDDGERVDAMALALLAWSRLVRPPRTEWRRPEGSAGMWRGRSGAAASQPADRDDVYTDL